MTIRDVLERVVWRQEKTEFDIDNFAILAVDDSLRTFRLKDVSWRGAYMILQLEEHKASKKANESK